VPAGALAGTRDNMADTAVPPVFFLNKTLPGVEEKNYSVVEMCSAAERVCGYETVVGAQRIGGLWRVYCANNDARIQLLTEGLIIRGHCIVPKDKNPFVVEGGNEETPTTKLIIGNVPMSYNNEDILSVLEKNKVKARSGMYDERGRDENGKLTRWKTGRRFLYISLPSTPLPKSLSVGLFQASLYYRERKDRDDATCGKCLQTGHNTKACAAPIKCRACLQDGHKTGDPACALLPPLSPSPQLPPPGLNPASKQSTLQFERRSRSATSPRPAAATTTTVSGKRERSPSTQRRTPTKGKPNGAKKIIANDAGEEGEDHT